MRPMLAITRKELDAYFGSPMALIFIAVFLAATLFSFFWVDTFFARGIADVRPLFRWMPLLLIFLVAALTMRQWSEEAQTGAIEILLTLPVSYWQLVLGKFLAVMTLVALALGLTLSLPITVSMLGNLDWGPVIGGYLAALLLAAAFSALGMFISSRTSNEIVALILRADRRYPLSHWYARRHRICRRNRRNDPAWPVNRQPIREHRARGH
jgi:ABC-2 type transport system permease protein